jgi:type IV pilus assembly protein PilB
MRTLDSKTSLAVSAIPRSEFLTSPENSALISAHALPSTMLVRTLLAYMPAFAGDEKALLIGVGTGYLASILARLIKRLIVVERNPAIAALAQENFAKVASDNIDLLIRDGALGCAEQAPFDLIVAVCALANPEQLLSQLTGSGAVVCLEEVIGSSATLVAWYRDKGGAVRRRKLGVLDFSRNIAETLVDLGLIDEHGAELATAEAAQLNKPVFLALQRKVNLEDSKIFTAIAQRCGLTFATADNLFNVLDKQCFRHFSRSYLDRHRLLPVRDNHHRLVVASDDPEAHTESLAQLYPCQGVDKLLVTTTDFQRLWSVLNISGKSDSFSVANDSVDGGNAWDDFATHLENHISPYLVAIYEAILFDAVSENASDIHLERYGQRVRVRLRVDGDLHELDHYQLTPAELVGVINVIKTRAQLNIAERRLPQGGRSHLKVGATSYDLRIQTQPSLHAEHAVIRLLPQRGRAMALTDLGLSQRIQRHYRRLLANPAGLVLIVGPTGSGKSTTLSAGLQELADDDRRKVITIEDPIEYAIDNIQQTRVRSNIGFRFADAMRSFVRQDPDVILVGEIRDTETALEAARASQTGHLVLSTLHCNDSVDAIQRLFDLGLHPNALAGELLAVMAQRLAKRICEHCKAPATPEPEILRELFAEHIPANFRCYAGAGCAQCHHRGTKGRTAVVEFLLVNSDLRDFISRQPGLGELRWRALDAGMITMRDSALELVLQGIIPLAELPRILSAERMAPELRGGVRSRL